MHDELEFAAENMLMKEFRKSKRFMEMKKQIVLQMKKIEAESVKAVVMDLPNENFKFAMEAPPSGKFERDTVGA